MSVQFIEIRFPGAPTMEVLSRAQAAWPGSAFYGLDGDIIFHVKSSADPAAEPTGCAAFLHKTCPLEQAAEAIASLRVEGFNV